MSLDFETPHEMIPAKQILAAVVTKGYLFWKYNEIHGVIFARFISRNMHRVRRLDHTGYAAHRNDS
jgi:hypothetical protein